MSSSLPDSRIAASRPNSATDNLELSDSNVLADLVNRKARPVSAASLSALPTNTNSILAESGQTESGQTEPGQTEPGQTESGQTELGESETGETEQREGNKESVKSGSSLSTTLFRPELDTPPVKNPVRNAEPVKESDSPEPEEDERTQIRSDCQPVNEATVIQTIPVGTEPPPVSSEIGSSPLAADQAIPGVEIVSDNLGPKFQLGNFTLIESVGGGGMGRVFRALDNNLERDVALKVLPPNQCTDKDYRDRFIFEAKAAARLHHDNIVCVYSFGEINGLTYLAMEYIPGINIRDLVSRDGPLPIEDVLAYAIQLASALEHINQQKIVHRDIKPSNVLVTDDGTVKVIDLGLAKATLAQSPADELTATGVTLGTFDYISPEQARDPRHVDIRSDIYSLGCSLFYMLAGHPPYPKGTALQKLLCHQGEAPPNIQEYRAEVPDRLADIITRCMAKNADLRYQTPQALSSALYLAAEELGMRPIGMSLTRWYMPSISRLRAWKERFWWVLPLAGLILCVMCLDSLWKLDLHESEYLPESMTLYPETHGQEEQTPPASTGLFKNLKIPTFPQDMAPPTE